MTTPAEMDARDRQDLCRRHVESAEAWLRMLVHFELKRKSGDKYLTEGKFKRSLIEHVEGKLREHGGRIMRQIDATTFEQITDIVCHPELWATFDNGLRRAYPNGSKEARTFLDRLRSIRNDVAHGRQCSARQLEQAICYSNDLADSVKGYLAEENMNRDFNVPTITVFTDNLGNGEHLIPGADFRGIDLSKKDLRQLYPGDLLVAEVEIDPSFPEEGYVVDWWLKTRMNVNGIGKCARIPITLKDVSERIELQFRVKTHNDWHRGSGGYDDILDIYYRVLPPPQ